MITNVSALNGIPFIKMTGSGNDFVIFEADQVDGSLVTSRDSVTAICNRHNGIGADGIVLLESRPPGADVRIQYFNSDGSRGDLCGNATLCSTAISIATGIGASSGMTLLTDAGLVKSRLHEGLPQIELGAVTDIRSATGIAPVPGEQKIGFALVGVPHLVVLCDDVQAVNLNVRGAELRSHPSIMPAGANVNFVAPLGDGRWVYRTFERGVEGETLACGTGSVATAILLNAWGLSANSATIRTSSGRFLTVDLKPNINGDNGFIASLTGEGRVVFRGTIGQL